MLYYSLSHLLKCRKLNIGILWARCVLRQILEVGLFDKLWLFPYEKALNMLKRQILDFNKNT